MLLPDGKIDFTQELLDLVDNFLAQYQERKGQLQNDLERGLVVAYILGVLRCDLESVWNSVGQADVFGSLQPRAIFEECTQQDAPNIALREGELYRLMVERGWFSSQSPDAPQDRPHHPTSS